MTDCYGAGNSDRLLFEASSETTGTETHLALDTTGPDSGLGSSNSSGPLHIEDWPSLAVLLPRYLFVDRFMLSSSNKTIVHLFCLDMWLRLAPSLKPIVHYLPDRRPTQIIATTIIIMPTTLSVSSPLVPFPPRPR